MDRRIFTRNKKWYSDYSKSTMLATVELYDEGEDDEVELTLPFKFEVCETCEGRGMHVDPNIDSNGLTREDFDNDPDFEEAYFGGRYDVPCYECGGNNVVPVPDEDEINRSIEHKNTYKRLKEKENDNAAYVRECEAERRMGA